MNISLCDLASSINHHFKKATSADSNQNQFVNALDSQALVHLHQALTKKIFQEPTTYLDLFKSTNFANLVLPRAKNIYQPFLAFFLKHLCPDNTFTEFLKQDANFELMIDLIVQEGDFSLFERSMKFILEENDKGLIHDSIARARKFYDAVLKRTAETGNLFLFFQLKNFGVIDGVNKEKQRLAISFLETQVDEIIDHLKQSQKESQTYDDLEKNSVYKFLCKLQNQ